MDGIEPQLVIGHNAEEIAVSIVRLLADSQERARLSTEGRRFVEAHCSLSCNADKLEKLCLAVAENNRLRQGTGLPIICGSGAEDRERRACVHPPDSLMRLDCASTISIW